MKNMIKEKLMILLRCQNGYYYRLLPPAFLSNQCENRSFIYY